MLEPKKDINEILNRIKAAERLGDGYGSESSLARFLGISPQRLKNWRDYYASGNNLYFDLGGGKEPGIWMSKTPGCRLCGMVKEGKQLGCFMNVPELTAIDSLAQ